jgi:ectoine hydroxylase-related dioxygenase (phytanoyl-CoA dioxygenase family)
VWVALTPVTTKTSPLTCLKGSHRTGLRYRPPVGIGKETPLPEGFVEQPDWDAAVSAGEWEKISFVMEPGDTLLIHPDTVHGAPPAEDGAPRRIGFTSRWAGDDVRWNLHDYALRIPGIDYADVTEGEPVGGKYFPEVWPIGN